jgi:hypothetical protein
MSTLPHAEPQSAPAAPPPVEIRLIEEVVQITPMNLKVDWQFCGPIVFNAVDCFFDQNPGVTFLDPNAPFTLISSDARTCLYQGCNDIRANTGIAYAYDVHVQGPFGKRLDDPTVENDPPPPDWDGQ